MAKIIDWEIRLIAYEYYYTANQIKGNEWYK